MYIRAAQLESLNTKLPAKTNTYRLESDKMCFQSTTIPILDLDEGELRSATLRNTTSLLAYRRCQMRTMCCALNTDAAKLHRIIRNVRSAKAWMSLVALLRRKAPLEICEAIAYCVFEPLQAPNDFPPEIQEPGNEDVWGAYMFHRQTVQELASAFLEYMRACELLCMCKQL